MSKERYEVMEENYIRRARLFGHEVTEYDIKYGVFDMNVKMLDIMYDLDESKMLPIEKRKVESLRISFDKMAEALGEFDDLLMSGGRHLFDNIDLG